MKKIMCLLLGVILLAGCGGFTKKEQQTIEEVDGMMYSYIVGKVEGNDDLLDTLLVPKAKGILKPGRHAFPGNAERMGERYMIKRYDNHFHDGLISYEIKFYRPQTGAVSYYILAVINTQDGWLVGSNTSLNQEYLNVIRLDEEGKPVDPVMVHEYAD